MKKKIIDISLILMASLLFIFFILSLKNNSKTNISFDPSTVFNHFEAPHESESFQSSTVNTEEIDIGITYYVSSTDGNDDYNGLSKDTPWKSLDKVSSVTYEAGDSILLKCGNEWEGTVRFIGSGTENDPIYVGSYGTGNKPILHGNGAETNRTLLYNLYSEISGTLEIIEGSYWHIDGLELTNEKAGTALSRVGILVIDNCTTQEEYIASPQYGITIENCYIHNVASDVSEKHTGGIIFIGNISNVEIDNNFLENVGITGIRNVSMMNSIYGQYGNNYLTAYKVSNNEILDIVGDCVVLDSVEKGSIEYNYVNGYCIGDPQKNYAALWTWACKDITIQYNEVTGGGSTNDDGTPFDVDYYNTDIVIQYNYTHGNQKGIAMFPSNSTGTVFRYNLSINDGQQSNTAIFPYAASDEDSAPLMYNNIIYQYSGQQSLNSNIFFNNYVGIEELYINFYNNIVISPGTWLLSSYNIIAAGSLEGNLFIPEDLISGSADKIGDGICSEDNLTLTQRESTLYIENIPIGEEPDRIITGYNIFDASILEEFIKTEEILAIGVDVKAVEQALLGNASPAQVDFFGNPLH